MYGNDKLPRWFNELPADIAFIRRMRTSIFAGMEGNTSLHYTSSVFWKKGMKELRISSPERTCLKMLNEVPDKISFEHADQLIQGMTSLSPRRLQKLLEAYTNIKVKEGCSSGSRQDTSTTGFLN